MAAVAAASFPIQIGLDHITDPPTESADYGTLMNLAQANGVPWLWWDWYNPYGTDNNLSRDGSADNLTATGRVVVSTHAASVANTARFACSDAPPPVVTPPATPPAASGVFIDAGGPAADNFAADRSFAAGHEAPRSSAAIDRSAIPAPVPPEAVYQTERWGAMTYRIGGFQPYSEHNVELHFAEVHFRDAGQRKFNVRLNDVLVLGDYDIVARAGAASKAVREVFSTRATYAGEIVIRFLRGSLDEPKISGIVIR